MPKTRSLGGKGHLAARVLLDANVWRYLADAEAGDDLLHASLRSGTKILIAPSVVYEALRTRDARIRQRLVELMTRHRWVRLLPEAYNESQEVLNEIRRLRPHWLRENPNLQRLTRFRDDWTRAKGGFWDRARLHTAREATALSSLNDNVTLGRARSAARQNRENMIAAAVDFGTIDLKRVTGTPASPIAGWDGDHIEAWRLNSFSGFYSVLEQQRNPYADWLSPLVDLTQVFGSSGVRFWFYDTKVANMPRFWIRWALTTLQALRSVSDGTPCDAQLGTYLIDCDHFVSADRTLIAMIEKCRDCAPARIAAATLIPGGNKGITALLSLLERTAAGLAD